MRRIRKWGCLVLMLLVLIPVTLTAYASQESATPYIQRMINYYLHYQEQAQTEIDTLLDYIESLDPAQAALWEKIMTDWSKNNSQLQINREVLPDGLPQDDSLCIVVLGYGLNPDGSMKEELEDRLVVALISAIKYPNAYIAVTGGETAGQPGISEAGQMAAWLRERGVEEHRLIVENQSLSTTENALNTYQILTASYPQVTSIAVISSDYHISWGCTMFTTVAHCQAHKGGRFLEVVGNAANATDNRSDTMHSQAWGICIITGIPFDGGAVPAKYWEEETTAPETVPADEPAAVEEEPDRSWMVFPAVVLALTVVVLFIPTKKKTRK